MKECHLRNYKSDWNSQIWHFLIKILSFIIGAFAVTTTGVLALANIQLYRILDKSQKDVYAEKIDTIWESLNRSNELLIKTGINTQIPPKVSKESNES